MYSLRFFFLFSFFISLGRCQRLHAVGMSDLRKQCVRFVRRLEIPLAYLCSSCFFVNHAVNITLLELVDHADLRIDTD